VQSFVRRTLQPADAYELAERLTLRDRELDGRVFCIECRHGRAVRCPNGLPMPLDVPHRCPLFETA